MNHEIPAAAIYHAARLLTRLPRPALRGLAAAIAWLWWTLDRRESRVARRNLELAYPQMPVPERQALQHAILRTTAWQAIETLRFWTTPPQRNLRHVRETHGVELFETAKAAGRPLLIAAPHYGNWELLNQWLASRGPYAFVYRVPESPIGDAFLLRARGIANVTQVRAEGSAVRQLWKALKAGGTVAILPDQQPKAGDGEFAPFFGVQALTMTLLSRLAERTDATVLVAYCERLGEGPDFALHFEPAPAAIASPDHVAAVTALNAAVEAVARRDPTQYQWTYKRYTLRPSGKGEDNPYR